MKIEFELPSFSKEVNIMIRYKTLIIVLSLILLYSFSFAQQAQQKEKTESSIKDKWANTTWRKVSNLTKEKRSFKVEVATTVAGVRSVEAEDAILKQLYYRGKGQYPTRLELKNAIEILNQIIKSDPEAPNVHESMFYIAQIYEQLGENQKAIDTYEEIIKDYPNSESAAEALIQIGNLKK